MTINDLLSSILGFINTTVVPLFFTIAFFVFVWNAVRYFMIESGSEEGRQKAKRLAVWGIIAFFILFSLWGIVNLFITMFGFDISSVRS